MRERRVRALLMGGQACVFYGAAEFSRDTDLAILADVKNLARLRSAFDDLQAEVIAVPPLELKHLRKGHAVHFRCQHPEAARMRVDVMSKMRGVDPFAKLWQRRTTIELSDGTVCDLVALSDLVAAKKTQRDKDWPMIRRLVEAHYFEHMLKPSREQIDFWLCEMRTPELLLEVAQKYPSARDRLYGKRHLLDWTVSGNLEGLRAALHEEEAIERERDREYWLPLKAELSQLRHGH